MGMIEMIAIRSLNESIIAIYDAPLSAGRQPSGHWFEVIVSTISSVVASETIGQLAQRRFVLCGWLPFCKP